MYSVNSTRLTVALLLLVIGMTIWLRVSHATIYVPNSVSSVRTYNTDTGAPLNIPLVSGLFSVIGIAVSGSALYVTDFLASKVIKYNAESGAVINPMLISGGNPYALAVSGNTLYTLDVDGTIASYNATTGAPINTSLAVVQTIARDIAVSDSGMDLFVTSHGSSGSPNNGTIYKFRTSDGAGGPIIGGLDHPEGIYVSGSSLYVAINGNMFGASIAQYSTTGTPINVPLITLPGNEPYDVAVTGTDLYVLMHFSGTIRHYNTSGQIIDASFVTGLNHPFRFEVIPEIQATLCNTGVTGGSNTCGSSLLQLGSADSHWSVGVPYPTAPSGPPITTLPLTFAPAFANVNASTWLPNNSSPTSGWIAPAPTATQDELGGQYVYRTTFMGDTPFGVRTLSDNETLDVYLNSVSLELPQFPSGPTDFSGIWTFFSVVSGLNTGSNTLDFVVRNRGQGGLDANPTPTGLRTEFSDACVNENCNGAMISTVFFPDTPTTVFVNVRSTCGNSTPNSCQVNFESPNTDDPEVKCQALISALSSGSCLAAGYQVTLNQCDSQTASLVVTDLANPESLVEVGITCDPDVFSQTGQGQPICDYEGDIITPGFRANGLVCQSPQLATEVTVRGVATGVPIVTSMTSAPHFSVLVRVAQDDPTVIEISTAQGMTDQQIVGLAFEELSQLGFLAAVLNDGRTLRLTQENPENPIGFGSATNDTGITHAIIGGQADQLPREFPPPPPPDTDGDGVQDEIDNCTAMANPDQRDTDGDGIGNFCDPDVATPNDCVVNFLDFGVYQANFFQPGDLDTDNNGDGQTNFLDLNFIVNSFFGSPGPSANGCN